VRLRTSPAEKQKVEEVKVDMEMFSMLKHHIVADGANPITHHFHLVRQVATAGQQHVWKIFDAKRIKDGKVQNFCCFSQII